MTRRRLRIFATRDLGVLAWAALALLAPLSGARAASTPDARARAVLERYLEASGGRAAWERDSTEHTRVAIEAFGLSGTSERWMARPDRAVTSTHLGALTLWDGVVGERAWRVDQNGKLMWLDDRELAEARGSAYFDLEMWLAPDLGGGQVAYEGEETEEAAVYDLLEITPPAGRRWVLSFDRRSGLLARMKQQGDLHTIETRLSEYAELAGRLRPRRSLTRVGGAPANDVTARLDSVATGVEVDSALFLPPKLGARDFRFLEGGTRAVIPFEYGSRHIWVEVSVDGQPPAWFLLDTGASVTVLDSAYAAGIGVSSQGAVSGHGAGATGRFAFARVQSLTVAGRDTASVPNHPLHPQGLLIEPDTGVELRDQNLMVASLNPFLAPALWRDVAGILGYDFLSRFVVTVDYDSRKLALDDPERFVYRGRGAELPIAFTHGVPVVRATIDRHEADFRLDVGSSSGLDLHTPFVKAHELEARTGRKMPEPGGGFGGTFERVVARMRSFALGPYTVKEPLVGLCRTTEGAMASEDFAGNVGNRVLERFTCTFDYGRKRLYLEPNARFAAHDEPDRFGAQFFRAGSEVRLGYVKPGSAAAESGLAAGDQVLTVAGQPVTTYTPDGLRSLFETSPEGTVVTVEATRDGRPQTFEVKLTSAI